MADRRTITVTVNGESYTREVETRLLLADFIRHEKPTKPIAAYVAGLHAPTERRMGHAGTVDVFGAGSAAEKIEALRSAGVHVAASAAEIGTTIRRAYKGL